MKLRAPTCAGAVAPDRLRWFETRGARLRGYEWGDPKAQPVLAAHGFFDHGRGYDLLAPLLAEKYRVISFDARGHGESSWTDTYAWNMDVQDILCMLRELGPGTHLIGHSKGGGQVTEAAILAGDAVDKLVSLDGFGPPDSKGFQHPGMPDLGDLTLPERCAAYLDKNRLSERKLEWKPRPSLDDLVNRRGEQNPRLDKSWLRYFVFHGAREAEDGWRWKGDPMMTGGRFDAFRPGSVAPAWVNLKATMLAVTGTVQDLWGPLPEEVLNDRLSYVPRVERVTIEGAGHFIHMEQPAATAECILDFFEAA